MENNLLNKTIKSFLFICVWAASVQAWDIGIEEKTGNIFSFQFGYGYNLKEPSIESNNGGGGGFNFNFVDSYEIFFTKMHGVRLSAGIGYGYSSYLDSSISGGVLKNSGNFFNAEINLDYRIDFYHIGKWDFGAFGGGGYGWSIYQVKKQTELILYGTTYLNKKYINFGFSGYNLEGGFIITYNQFIQFEFNLKYRDRGNFSNISTLAGIGFKF